uniref:Uncharacterized protein n=1 Tax=Romanomermis culicivorax TaxID=13658 RepID=A0A915I6C1_ROMCU
MIETDHTAVKSELNKENPAASIAISFWGLALAGVNLDIQPGTGYGQESKLDGIMFPEALYKITSKATISEEQKDDTATYQI